MTRLDASLEESLEHFSMGETKLKRVAAYVEPQIHEELNKICQQNGCTMSVLISRFIEDQLSSSADSADSFSSSSSLADSAENTLLKNQVKSLENDVTNIKAVLAELRNNPESELADSAGSAVTQLGENLRNKPDHLDDRVQGSTAESAESQLTQLTQLKRRCNELENEKENLQAKLEESDKKLQETFKEMSSLEKAIFSLEKTTFSLKQTVFEAVNWAFSQALFEKSQHAQSLQKINQLTAELDEHKAWVKNAGEFHRIPH